MSGARYPADKYRLKSADLLRAVQTCAAPRAEAARLIDLLAFSYLIGNGRHDEASRRPRAVAREVTRAP